MFKNGLNLNSKTYLEILVMYPEAIENAAINELLSKKELEK